MRDEFYTELEEKRWQIGTNSGELVFTPQQIQIIKNEIAKQEGDAPAPPENEQPPEPNRIHVPFGSQLILNMTERQALKLARELVEKVEELDK
jgi:hypothetical protein